METNDRKNLTDQTCFRLNEISKIKKYFNSGINQRKSCSKKLSKYIVALDYIDKVLIFLSTSSGGVCIISSVNVNGAQIWGNDRKFKKRKWEIRRKNWNHDLKK